MLGKEFGDWKIISEGIRTKHNSRQWICRCKCGFERLFTTSFLNSYPVTMCPTCREHVRKKEDDDISLILCGKEIGTYTVLRMLNRNKYGSRQWLCKCRCGFERVFFTSHLNGAGKKKATICEKCCLQEMELMNRVYDQIPNRFWHKFLNVAQRREISVSITKDDLYDLYLSQEKKCALTGLSLYFTLLNTNFNRYTNASLDRIDSSKPYEKGNIQWVEKRINMMKNSYSQSDFISLCELVTIFNTLKRG